VPPGVGHGVGVGASGGRGTVPELVTVTALFDGALSDRTYGGADAFAPATIVCFPDASLFSTVSIDSYGNVPFSETVRSSYEPSAFTFSVSLFQFTLRAGMLFQLRPL
jgi:hypothetical protein